MATNLISKFSIIKTLMLISNYFFRSAKYCIKYFKSSILRRITVENFFCQPLRKEYRPNLIRHGNVQVMLRVFREFFQIEIDLIRREVFKCFQTYRYIKLIFSPEINILH